MPTAAPGTTGNLPADVLTYFIQSRDTAGATTGGKACADGRCDVGHGVADTWRRTAGHNAESPWGCQPLWPQTQPQHPRSKPRDSSCGRAFRHIPAKALEPSHNTREPRPPRALWPTPSARRHESFPPPALWRGHGPQNAEPRRTHVLWPTSRAEYGESRPPMRWPRVPTGCPEKPCPSRSDAHPFPFVERAVGVAHHAALLPGGQ